MSNSSLNPGDVAAQLVPYVHAGHWYVALSGGLDSSVLLHLVQRIRQHMPDAPALTAIHVNHGLHPDASRWQTLCHGLCDTLDVELLSVEVAVDDTPDGLEAAAREARYTVFERVLAAGDVLFMAHHLDDQIETFFLRLMRGAGPQGLSGMPQTRNLGQGCLLRPLLEFPRAQLQAYALE